MKNKFYFLGFLIINFSLTAKEIVLDKIIAKVNGRLLLKSQLAEPQLIKNGKRFTLEELIVSEIVTQKAEELGSTPSLSDLDSAINAEKIDLGGQGMTDQEFENRKLKSLGLSFGQYRNQLYRYYSSEYLLGRLISNKLVISAQEIEKFYTENPVYTEEKVHILISPTSSKKPESSATSWQDLGWCIRKDLDQSYQAALKGLKVGQKSSSPIEKNGKYFFVMLKNIKPAEQESLSSRYNEIKSHLREIRREPFVKNFIEEIKNKAIISYP